MKAGDTGDDEEIRNSEWGIRNADSTSRLAFSQYPSSYMRSSVFICGYFCAFHLEPIQEPPRKRGQSGSVENVVASLAR